MSRFDSDMDFYDEPWKRPIRCASAECDNHVAVEGWLCPDCQMADAIQAERERQQHSRDDAFVRGLRKASGA